MIEAKWEVESNYKNIDTDTVLSKFKEISTSKIVKEKDEQYLKLKENNDLLTWQLEQFKQRLNDFYTAVKLEKFEKIFYQEIMESNKETQKLREENVSLSSNIQVLQSNEQISRVLKTQLENDITQLKHQNHQKDQTINELQTNLQNLLKNEMR